MLPVIAERLVGARVGQRELRRLNDVLRLVDARLGVATVVERRVTTVVLVAAVPAASGRVCRRAAHHRERTDASCTSRRRGDDARVPCASSAQVAFPTSQFLPEL